MMLMSSGASSSGIGFDPFTPTATFLIPCTGPVYERGRVSSILVTRQALHAWSSNMLPCIRALK